MEKGHTPGKCQCGHYHPTQPPEHGPMCVCPSCRNEARQRAEENLMRATASRPTPMEAAMLADMIGLTYVEYSDLKFGMRAMLPATNDPKGDDLC